MANTRFQIIPAVYLVLRRDGKILLARRAASSSYMGGYYSMIAGHLDGDESLVVALAREVDEESGLKVDPKNLKLVHIMHTRSEEPNTNDDERIDFYFEADDIEGNPSIMEPDKCDDMQWFDIDHLPKKIVPRVRQAIQCIDDKILYSQMGW